MKIERPGQAQKLQKQRLLRTGESPLSSLGKNCSSPKRAWTLDGAIFYSCLPAATSGCCQISVVQKLSKRSLDKLLACPRFLSGIAKGLQLAVWDFSINSMLFPTGSMASLKCLFSLLLGKVHLGTNCAFRLYTRPDHRSKRSVTHK